jgi:hypothetical protein
MGLPALAALNYGDRVEAHKAPGYRTPDAKCTNIPSPNSRFGKKFVRFLLSIRAACQKLSQSYAEPQSSSPETACAAQNFSSGKILYGKPLGRITLIVNLL